MCGPDDCLLGKVEQALPRGPLCGQQLGSALAELVAERTQDNLVVFAERTAEVAPVADKCWLVELAALGIADKGGRIDADPLDGLTATVDFFDEYAWCQIFRHERSSS